jgi:hypothetical protein
MALKTRLLLRKIVKEGVQKRPTWERPKDPLTSEMMESTSHCKAIEIPLLLKPQTNIIFLKEWLDQNVYNLKLKA